MQTEEEIETKTDKIYMSIIFNIHDPLRNELKEISHGTSYGFDVTYRHGNIDCASDTIDYITNRIKEDERVARGVFKQIGIEVRGVSIEFSAGSKFDETYKCYQCDCQTLADINGLSKFIVSVFTE